MALRSLTEGDRLSRYQIVRLLGSGGMADVYEALHLGLNKRVAIKVLRPEVAESEEASRRFLAEGEVASRIRHPHVVDVTDVGTEGGVTFLVMEFLEGWTLASYVERHGRLRMQDTVDLILPVLAALAEAHAQGVVHRDIKPDNVFLARTTRGQLVPKLVDFGISKVVDTPNLRNTGASTVLGTPFYMSPEQARGIPDIDSRSDQFSAAMMLYECLVGKVPYEGRSLVQLIHEVAACNIPPFATHGVELPSRLEATVMRALSRDPSDRFERIEDFAEALLAYATQRGKMAYAAARQSAVAPLSELPEPGEAGHARTLEIPAAARVPRDSLAETIAARPSTGTPQPVETSAVQTGATTAAGLRHPKRRLAWIGGAAAAVVLLVAGLTWGRSDGEPQPTARVEVAPQVPAPEAAPPETPPEPDAVPPEPEPEPPPLFTVRTTAQPARAAIELDGQVVGHGSIVLRLPADGTTHRLRVTADGYESQEVTFRDVAPAERIVLERVAEAPRPRRRAPRRATPPAPTQGPPPADDIRLTR